MAAGICILVHVIVMILLIRVWKRGYLKVNIVTLAPVCLIPLFGEILLLVLHALHSTGFRGQKGKELEMMRSDMVRSSIYRQDPDDGDNSVVPLEDVLILGDSRERRTAMLDVLMDSSGSSMSAIRRAKRSEDTEVVHYATTAMTEISKKYDLYLQRASLRYQHHPDSDEALDRYIYVLSRYLDDEMAEGELLEIQRHQYQVLLRERIRRKHERDDYADLAASLMDSGEYEEADRLITILERKWFHWERTLNIRLRFLFELQEGEKIRKLLLGLQKEKFIPEKIQEIMRFWLDQENRNG